MRSGSLRATRTAQAASEAAVAFPLALRLLVQGCAMAEAPTTGAVASCAQGALRCALQSPRLLSC
jgi:hypothetical protein